jgi:hypothetical protein
MRRAVLTVLAAICSLAAAPVASADTASSTNWAGYAVHGASFRRVLGSWRQPSVSCHRGSEGFSAYWVGLGGFSVGAQALEQIGTEADCLSDGTESLSAWYEMVPAASVTIPMIVAPGDLIDAEVTVRGHAATLTLIDRTRHRAFSRTVRSGPVDVSSAEWIVEAPSDCSIACTTLPLADFGSAVFSAARAQPVGGPAGTLTDRRYRLTTINLQPAVVHMAAANGGATGGSGGAGAVTRAPTAGGSAFEVSVARARVMLHRELEVLRQATARH